MKLPKYSSLALGLVLVAGCGAPEPEPAPTPATVPMPTINVSADAGVPVTQSADPKQLAAVAKQVGLRLGGPRQDPFALKPSERQYEIDQSTARLYASTGPFSSEFTPPSEQAQTPPPTVEPQPYRRLAGVIVGDSVLAIIDMGNGQTELIRPGQLIPGTQWRVVSIDQEKAVLRRSGNVLPHEVTVRLESPPPGMGGGGGFGGPPSGFGGPPTGSPGGPPTGYPGGPPAGYPGGRPGAGGDPGLGGRD